MCYLAVVMSYYALFLLSNRMKDILSIAMLGLLFYTGVFGFHGNILSEEFVKFHNSRTDVTWEVMLIVRFFRHSATSDNRTIESLK